jgi:hypothetical protein
LQKITGILSPVIFAGSPSKKRRFTVIYVAIGGANPSGFAVLAFAGKQQQMKFVPRKSQKGIAFLSTREAARTACSSLLT